MVKLLNTDNSELRGIDFYLIKLFSLEQKNICEKIITLV